MIQLALIYIKFYDTLVNWSFSLWVNRDPLPIEFLEFNIKSISAKSLYVILDESSLSVPINWFALLILLLSESFSSFKTLALLSAFILKQN